MTPSPWRTQISIAPMTSMKLGGPARFFYEFSDAQDLSTQIKKAKSTADDFFILGGGSNIVVSDHGIHALVLKSVQNLIQIESSTNEIAVVTAESGALWDDLVLFCVNNGLAGIECLSGIPGTVGAAPIQNIGAYGQELADVFLDLTALNTKDLTIHRLNRADCRFSYRNSRFKPDASINPEWIILSIRLGLKKSGPAAIRYPELSESLSAVAPNWPSQSTHEQLALIRSEVLKIRRRKSMVIDAANPNTRSCGSFFTNPIITHEDAMRIQDLVKDLQQDRIPEYPAEGGHVKLSAARIVELCGFARGFVYQSAGISTDHALALVSRGESAQDVYDLARKIQERALKRFGIKLETEPSFIGQFSAQKT